MKKSISAILTMVLVLGTVLAGCGGNKETLGENERYKITVGYPKADETWDDDEYFKYVTDKVNVDIEFQSISADSASEKARIWISSGSMPDIVYSTFLMDEYKKYGEQGMVKALPDDWEEKYPNLGFSMAMTGALAELKKIDNGKIYGLLRPLDHYGNYLDEFRAAYAEGKDLKEMMSESYTYIDKDGFAYRKDWAEKLGIKTDYIMDYDDFMDMALKFKEADLGGVGEASTVGIAVDYTEAPWIFVFAHNPNFNIFYKNAEGRYVSGLTDEATTEGVKAYRKAYETGVLSPDFYTQKTQDLNSVFCSQRSGIIFPRSEVSYLRTLKSDFAKANPGIDPNEAIGICWLRSPNGKVSGREAGNYNGSFYFNPDMSDDKFAKILELADYVSSPEGGPQIRLGVPGVDYKPEGDDFVITREKNEYGVWDNLNLKYPSYEFFRNFINPQYNQVHDVDPQARQAMNELTEAKLSEETNLVVWDVPRDSYVAEDYVKFNAAYETNSMFAEIVVSEGDVEENWNKKKAEIAEAAKGVEENMNKALLGK